MIVALRALVLASDASVREGIKWNAPSFLVDTDFATMHLRTKGGVGLILHAGAKKRAFDAAAIEDPDRLLTWLGDDRAMLVVTDLGMLEARRTALTALLRNWIAVL